MTRRFSRTLVSSTFMTLLVSVGTFAQGNTPEAVTQQYFDTLRVEGMVAAVKFMHPDALAQFKTMLLPVFEAEAAAGQSQARTSVFGPTSTVAQLQDMAPAMFMSAFMKVVTSQPGMAQLTFDRLEIVGVVSEGEQRHVLARITMGAKDVSVTSFEVVSLMPFEGSWRLQLNAQMKGLAAALAARMPAIR